jgi:cellulose synthase/poly-beta-1,6-N-acetylglucosamine synthase-like glycosyltransferase
MCIFSNGYNIATTNRYKKYFSTIERLNYTNFRLIVEDDNSLDGTIETLYAYLQNTTLTIKNKVTMVRSLERIRSIGHLYIGVRQQCNYDDVVVNIDADDEMMGIQTLKVLNAIYQNP